MSCNMSPVFFPFPVLCLALHMQRTKRSMDLRMSNTLFLHKYLWHEITGYPILCNLALQRFFSVHHQKCQHLRLQWQFRFRGLLLRCQLH